MVNAVEEYDNMIDCGSEPTWLEDALYEELASAEMYVQQLEAELLEAQGTVVNLSLEFHQVHRVTNILAGMLSETADVLKETQSPSATLSYDDVLAHLLDVAQALEEYNRLP